MVEQRGRDTMEEGQEPASPTQEAQTQTKNALSPIRRCCDKIVRGLETLFYWWGYYVGLYPKVVIAVTVIVAGALSSGMVFFKEENMPEKLWLPTRSETSKNMPYIRKYFPTSQRYTQVVVVAPDVLEPSVIKGMYELDRKLKSTHKSIKYSYRKVCAKAGPMCWSNSLLELWRFNKKIIYRLTRRDILKAVNKVKVSPVFYNEFDVTKILSKIRRDENGTIIGAEATQLNYGIKVNSSADEQDKSLQRALSWEKYFLDTLSERQEGIPEHYYYALRSYDDEAKGGTYQDLYLLGVGYGLMVIFISIVLGNFNSVEHRVYLGLAGIGAVAMALSVSLGVGCYTNVFYGPIHNVLAFLLLGLGVDDMFVIVQAMDCVERKIIAKEPVHVQVAYAMKSAGVSITVTSLTDILAFAVGTTTTIPSLWAFCVYCVIGITATYLLQATFFVACLTLDQQRALAKKDACCFCCIKHKKIEKNRCNRYGVVQVAFKKVIGPLITIVATKVTIILVAVGALGFSIYGVIHLEQMTDLAWVFPDNSYARDYIYAQREYFPDAGTRTMVYMGNVDGYRQFGMLEKLRSNIQEDWYIENGSVDCWFYAYRSWLNHSHIPIKPDQLDASRFPSNEENFYGLLKVYLATKGRRFVQDVRFNKNFTRVIASRFTAKHTNMFNSHEEVRGMEHIQRITANSGFGERMVVPDAGIPYITMEMNKVIKDELYRNIGLALICVAIMTFPLIADLQASLLVFLNVVLILVNVAGLMHLLGLNIDVVTSLILILAIGMSVDYAAHVGHTFMTITGTKNERASKTLGRIGPAVFYGGFSTFLALSPLSFATVYTLNSFFQVFAAIVVSGLFHGLLLLPVILSLIGPEPYPSATENRTLREHEEEYPVDNLEPENRRSMLLHRTDSQEDCNAPTHNKESGPPAREITESSKLRESTDTPEIRVVEGNETVDDGGESPTTVAIKENGGPPAIMLSREDEVLQNQNKTNGFSIL